MAIIAVVDDDQDSRDIFTAFLEHHGYIVQQFASAEDFLVRFRPGTLRLILMDISMPGMDGYDLVAIVHKMDPSVPAVAVTARAHEVNRRKALAVGFSAFVTKPITDLDGFLNRSVNKCRKTQITLHSPRKGSEGAASPVL
jgi:CheY-like chemotaxis protein